MKNLTKAIIVTGTPGAGKTTISHKLASKLDIRYVCVTELVKKHQLFTSEDKERQTLVADPKKVSEQLQQILDNTQGKIIIEGHYAPDVVPKKEVYTVFVLRRDPRELKNVLEKRGYNEKKVWENLASEILDVCLLDALTASDTDKVCEIDVSGKTVEAVVDEMILVLEKRKNCNFGTVDWLAKLANDGQLDEYLKKIG